MWGIVILYLQFKRPRNDLIPFHSIVPITASRKKGCQLYIAKGTGNSHGHDFNPTYAKCQKGMWRIHCGATPPRGWSLALCFTLSSSWNHTMCTWQIATYPATCSRSDQRNSMKASYLHVAFKKHGCTPIPVIWIEEKGNQSTTVPIYWATHTKGGEWCWSLQQDPRSPHDTLTSVTQGHTEVTVHYISPWSHSVSHFIELWGKENFSHHCLVSYFAF